MVIGECSKEADIEVNPVKAKQLTNIRAAGKEDTIKLIPPIGNSLERLICYIQDDEVFVKVLMHLLGYRDHTKEHSVTEKDIGSSKEKGHEEGQHIGFDQV